MLTLYTKPTSRTPAHSLSHTRALSPPRPASRLNTSTCLRIGASAADWALPPPLPPCTPCPHPRCVRAAQVRGHVRGRRGRGKAWGPAGALTVAALPIGTFPVLNTFVATFVAAGAEARLRTRSRLGTPRRGLDPPLGRVRGSLALIYSPCIAGRRRSSRRYGRRTAETWRRCRCGCGAPRCPGVVGRAVRLTD